MIENESHRAIMYPLTPIIGISDIHFESISLHRICQKLLHLEHTSKMQVKKLRFNSGVIYNLMPN